MKAIGKINLCEIYENDLKIILMSLEILKKIGLEALKEEEGAEQEESLYLIQAITALSFMLENSDNKEIMEMFEKTKKIAKEEGGIIQ